MASHVYQRLRQATVPTDAHNVRVEECSTNIRRLLLKDISSDQNEFRREIQWRLCGFAPNKHSSRNNCSAFLKARSFSSEYLLNRSPLAGAIFIGSRDRRLKEGSGPRRSESKAAEFVKHPEHENAGNAANDNSGDDGLCVKGRRSPQTACNPQQR
jgi:hypothetical protein